MFEAIQQLLVFTLCVGTVLTKCLFGDPEHCVLPCRCGGDGLCDSRTGQCFQGQCLTSQAMQETDQGQGEATWEWQGPACQVGNVAFQKKAISNDHSTLMGEWAEPNAMTDGITHSSTRTCPVIWTMSNKPAAWLIDLEVPHKVSGFILYVFSKSVGKVKLTVGNSTNLSDHITCAQLKSKRGIGRKLYTELNCTTNLIGRYVSVVKNPELDDVSDSLELCEIAVIGHIHTETDWTQCMDQNFNEVWCTQCQNSLPPACTEACQPGKYGLNCKLSCEPCEGECNPQTGKCKDGISTPTQRPEVTETNMNKSETTGIEGVVFTSNEEDIMHDNDEIIGSSTEIWDHTDVESIVSVNVNEHDDADVIMTHQPRQCVEGYFGEKCSTRCGMCFKREYCDMDTGRCPDGCEDWYISVNHECDTAIPRIDLNKDNVQTTSLPDGFKIELVDIKQVGLDLEEHYKGELRYFPNDGAHKLKSQRYMLNFYPTNGSFGGELVIDNLKANTNYDISVVIFRTLEGRINPGSSVSTSIVTSKVKALPRQQSGMDTSHYSFIIMLTVLVTLVICVAGTLVYLCMRAKKRKSLDDSQTDTESSSDFLKESPIYLTKTEPDPIYHFIDDGGETRCHLYHDINDFAHEKSQNFSNNNALKRFSMNAIERDSLLGNNPRMRNSFVPEMNELCEFRPPHCLNNEKLNQGYLTTASLQANFVSNSWDAQTKQVSSPTASEPPRYIKASQQGTTAHPYPSAATKLQHHRHQQQMEESDYLMPRSVRRDVVNQVQDYMMPVSQYPGGADRHSRPVPTSGYIPMDSPTESHRHMYSGGMSKDEQDSTRWEQHATMYDDSHSDESGGEFGNRPSYQSYVHMS